MNKQDQYEIRRRNLALLVEKYKGPTKLAHLIKTDRAYITQIINKATTSGGKVRNMGSELSERIENLLDLTPGWMEMAHESTDEITYRPSQEMQVNIDLDDLAWLKLIAQLSDDQQKQIKSLILSMITGSHSR